MSDVEPTISCRINGIEWQGTVGPTEVVLDFLRDRLTMTGTKRGCEWMVCGACTVLVDGLPTYACNMLAADLDAVELRTVEGLADNGTAIPPDTMGTAGADHLFNPLNNGIRISDLSGATTFPVIPLNAFWTSLGVPEVAGMVSPSSRYGRERSVPRVQASTSSIGSVPGSVRGTGRELT